MASSRRPSLGWGSIILVLSILLIGVPFAIWNLRRASAANQIQNGSFETDLSFWQLDLLRGTDGSASRDTTTAAEGGASARIDITKPKNGLDTAQFYQGGLSLAEGQGYSLSFWARAVAARPIEVVLRTPTSPWTEYVASTQNLTTSWAQYSLCLAPGVTDSNVTLHFGVGDNDASVWLDGIELDEAPIAVDQTAKPSTVPEPGGTITFTVTVTNTGLRPLYVTSMVDNVYGDVTDPTNPALEATSCATGAAIPEEGGTYRCTFQAQVAGSPGTHEDQLAVRAQDAEGRLACAADTTRVIIVDQEPSIRLVKTADPDSLPEPGGPITFALRIDNTSPEPVSLTSLVDDVYGSLDGLGLCALPQDIAGDGSYDCTFSGQVTGFPGQHTDTVTATVEDDEGNVVLVAASAVVTITDLLPSIAAGLDADPASLPAPGGVVTFSVEIANTGSETVTLTSLTDDVYGDLDGVGSCRLPRPISIASAYSCAYQSQVSGGPGEYVSVVAAVGEDDDGNVVEESDGTIVTITPSQQGIAVLKTAMPANLPEPGGTVTFTVRVTNHLGLTLTLTSLVDDVYGSLNGKGTCQLPQTLSAGDDYPCTFQAEVAGPPGAYVSTVTATARDDTGNTVVGQSSAVVTIVDLLPSIAVLKSIVPSELTEPGGTVTLTVRVTNTSTEDVTLTWLTDSVYGDLNGKDTCAVPRSIPPGHDYVCWFQEQVSGLAGEHTDLVTATAHDDEGNAVVEHDQATVSLIDVLPAIALTKSASPTVLTVPGGTVEFAVQVDNHSVEPVTLDALLDDVYGDLDGQGLCQLPRVLPTGGSYRCTFPGAVTGPAGHYADTVTAGAYDDEGNSAQAQDDVVVSLISPGLQVTLTADRERAYVGETISYLYTVQNAGDVTLTGVRAVDARLGPIALGSTVLSPGQVTTGTALYTVRSADLPGPLLSSVTAYGQPPVGPELSSHASDTVEIEAAIYLPLMGRGYAGASLSAGRESGVMDRRSLVP
jgi:hypothetical protein